MADIPYIILNRFMTDPYWLIRIKLGDIINPYIQHMGEMIRESDLARKIEHNFHGYLTIRGKRCVSDL